VAFGMYSLTELTAMVPSLLRCLSTPLLPVQPPAWLQAKLKILAILNLLADLRLDYRVRALRGCTKRGLQG
jgi:hypothetical protein